MRNNLTFIMIILIVFLPNLLYCEDRKEIGPELLWEKNGVVVCSAEHPQGVQSLVLDGEGGVIVVWNDSRNDPYCYMVDRGYSPGRLLPWSIVNIDIYAQRIDGNGIIRWESNGIQISKEKDSQSGIGISDGEGGAIVVWNDNRKGNDFDIYTQRINRDAAVLWEKTGIVVCDKKGLQLIAGAIPDGEHGVIIIWHDSTDIYTQRIDSKGNIKWGKDGVILSEKKIWKGYVNVIPDNDNGAIVLWEKMIKQNERDIYAQRIDKDGKVLWGENGIPVCDAVKSQGFPQMIPDGKGGAIIVWEDWRNDVYEINNINNCDIYAQRINGKGEMLWGKNGICVADEKGQLRIPMIVSDNEGGAIIFWNRCSYGQKINSNGEKLWKKEGIEFPWIKYVSDNVECISDNYGGVLIVWSENRDYPGWKEKTSLKIQRINKDGVALWNKDGIIICDADNYQGNPQIVFAGENSAVIVWGDNRKKYDKYNYDTNIYAQKIRY